MYAISSILSLTLGLLTATATAAAVPGDTQIEGRDYFENYTATVIVYSDNSCTQDATTFKIEFHTPGCVDFNMAAHSMMLINNSLSDENHCGIIGYPVGGCVNLSNYYWGPITELNTCWDIDGETAGAGEFTCID